MMAKKENDDAGSGRDTGKNKTGGGESSLLPMLISGLILIVIGGVAIMMFV